MSALAEERLLISINDLPTLPNTLTKILRIANDPDATLGELEGLVSRDPSLAARVLQVANSALYGARNIGSLRNCMALLGLRQIQNIAAAMALSPQFHTQNHPLIEGIQLWKHALAVASWGQRIAQCTHYPYPDHLFSAGLLHDIGIIVLFKIAPESMGKCLTTSKEQQRPLHEIEQEYMQTSHARIGALLCTKWMLPPILTQLTLHHHADVRDMGVQHQILNLAEYIAMSQGHSEFSWLPPRELPIEVLNAMKIKDDDLENIFSHANQINDFIETISAY